MKARRIIMLASASLIALGIVGQARSQHDDSIKKRRSTGQTQRPEDARQLSQVLPEKLGAFVVKTGTDRSLTVTEAIDVGKLLAGEADLDTLVKLLRPAEVVEHTFALTVVGVKGGKTLGVASEAVRPQLIAVSNVLLENGPDLEVGDGLLVGDTIALGFVINTGKEEVVLSTGSGGEIVIGAGVLLRAGGCTMVETCDGNGNCTRRCEGACQAGECVRVTVDNPDGSTRSWCECLNVHPPQ